MRPAREPDGSAAARAVHQIRECAVYQRSRHACCAWRPPALRVARKFARVALYWQTLILQIGVNFKFIRGRSIYNNRASGLDLQGWGATLARQRDGCGKGVAAHDLRDAPRPGGIQFPKKGSQVSGSPMKRDGRGFPKLRAVFRGEAA